MKNSVHESLLAYASAGYSVTPLAGKIPVMKRWEETPFDPLPDLTIFQGNFGVVLQADDLVIDVDPRNFKSGDKPLKRLGEKLGIVFKDSALVVQTGGGGWHLYYKKPSDIDIVETLPEYPGIEFKSRGRQVVGAGCTHPDTGQPYKLLTGDLKHIQLAPEALLAAIKRERRLTTRPESNIAAWDDSDANLARYKDYLLSAPLAVQGEQGDKATFTVACKGKTLGLSPDKTLALVSEFYNPLCSPPWTPEELSIKIKNAYAYSQNGIGADNPLADFSAIEPTTPAPKIRWDFAENGLHKKTLNNCANYFFLETSPLFGLLAYNEFIDQTVLIRPAPWDNDKTNFPRDGRAWCDEDSVMCRYLLSNQYKFDVSVKIVDEAAIVASRAYPNHPVRNYLESLKWDGVKRLDTWLADYCGAEENTYVRTVGAKTLVGAVARVFSPGCKFDFMLVLEGEQGTGKSSVVQILGGPWYGDITIDPHAKDTVAAMRGKWFCEASEMEFTTRSESQALKAFITRQVDHVRLAYARHVRAFSRQCIFIGTMNVEADPGYLKDMTGNRRFWPVLTTSINLAGLASVRDQLFAEALVRYQGGESLFIEDDGAAKQAIAEQHARRQIDPWLDRIENWLESDDFGRKINVITTLEIWTQCLNGMEKNISRREQCRIANIMQNELGWAKGTYYHEEKKKTVNAYKRKKI